MRIGQSAATAKPSDLQPLKWRLAPSRGHEPQRAYSSIPARSAHLARSNRGPNLDELYAEDLRRPLI